MGRPLGQGLGEVLGSGPLTAMPIWAWLPMLVVFATALAPNVARAQPRVPTGEMTVDDVVVRAIADNPDLRAARAEVDAAIGRLQQAGLRPNPMLEFGGQKALGPDNNLSIGLIVPLDRGGRKEGRVGVAERELQLKRAQVRDRERRLTADVRMKAGEYFAAKRNLGVTEELLLANRDALRLVQDRVREGAIPAIEENLILVEVNRLGATREVQASRIEISALQLKALAGMAPDAPLLLRGELTAPSSLPEKTEALRRAIETRADLDAGRAEVATASARIKKEQAEGRWDASVNFGYQRQDFGFMLNGFTDSGATRPIQDVFHYFGAGVTITLPVRNRNQGNVAAAEAETRAAERRLEFMELMARQEVGAAFTQYEAAQRSLQIYERGVRDVARRNLEIVRQTHELGRISLLDVIAEQRRYIDIENGYTEVLRQVYDAAVEIERAVGPPSR
jgi:cobalt-zinc-cadmium efflux system outer membrane protein